MSTYVYAFGDNGTPVGILQGNILFDTYGRTPIAAADSNGGLYLGGVASGAADYYLVGNYVRETTPNGRIIFTIRGSGICDGNGQVPTFHCMENASNKRMALALTAISHIGGLNFRPSNADVVDSRDWSGSLRTGRTSQYDIAKANVTMPDPFGKRTQPDDLKSRFGEQKRDSSYYKNCEAMQTPPKSASPSGGTAIDDSQEDETDHDYVPWGTPGRDPGLDEFKAQQRRYMEEYERDFTKEEQEEMTEEYLNSQEVKERRYNDYIATHKRVLTGGLLNRIKRWFKS